MRQFVLGIVGIGSRGAQHARLSHVAGLYSKLVLIDQDLEKAQLLAQELPPALAASDYRPVLAQVTALVVATPTETHYSIAKEALQAGVHVLLEKPPTRTLRELQELLELAAHKKTYLKIGYSERSNPFLDRVRSLLKTPPFFIESYRLSPFPGRSLDVDVVNDLMIHDLDLTMYFLNQRPLSMEAIGLSVITPHVDMAKAQLKFEDLSEVHLTASRISEKRYRKFRMFSRHLLITLDFLDKTIEVYSPQAIPSFSLPGEISSSEKISHPIPELSSLLKTSVSFSHVNPLQELHLEFLRDIEQGFSSSLSDQDILAFELSQKVSQKIQEFHQRIS